MIQIIGAGAIGCLWLAKLHQSGYPCHLVSRPSTKCLQQQLYFTDLQGQQHQFAISHSQQLLTAKVDEQQSTILVCVKAPQVLSALLNQQQYISPHQVIILMHNGYGCAEEVKQHFPENSIICATTAKKTGVAVSFRASLFQIKRCRVKLTGVRTSQRSKGSGAAVAHCRVEHELRTRVVSCKNIFFQQI